jgi:hypothetical protein
VVVPHLQKIFRRGSQNVPSTAQVVADESEQEFATDDMGPAIALRGSNSESPISALGQKPTYALQQAMSALHQIATVKAKFRKRPCPLYPESGHAPLRSMRALVLAAADHAFESADGGSTL